MNITAALKFALCHALTERLGVSPYWSQYQGALKGFRDIHRWAARCDVEIGGCYHWAKFSARYSFIQTAAKRGRLCDSTVVFLLRIVTFDISCLADWRDRHYEHVLISVSHRAISPTLDHSFWLLRWHAPSTGPRCIPQSCHALRSTASSRPARAHSSLIYPPLIANLSDQLTATPP